MSKTRTAILILFILGLVYLLWPGPSSIEDIPAIPNSLKSDEPGDTIQNENIAAYFAQEDRKFITDFYYDNFSYINFFGIKIPALRFNHPVEDSQSRVRDQIKSTYLEEYAYPFRDSIYVSGYDKVVWNELNHITTDELNKNIEIHGETFSSKSTVRYYGSSIFWRVFIYIGFWVLAINLVKISFKAVKKY